MAGGRQAHTPRVSRQGQACSTQPFHDYDQDVSCMGLAGAYRACKHQGAPLPADHMQVAVSEFKCSV